MPYKVAITNHSESHSSKPFCLVTEDLVSTELPFGWGLQTKTAPSPWMIIIHYELRKDRKTSWLITLSNGTEDISIVKGVRSDAGAAKAMEKALHKITESWHVSINQEDNK